MLWNAGFVLNQKGTILGIRFLNNRCILHRYYTNPRPNPYNLPQEQPPFFKEEKQHSKGFLTGSCLKSFNGTSDGLKIGKGRRKNLNECLIILKTLNASFTLLLILYNCERGGFIWGFLQSPQTSASQRSTITEMMKLQSVFCEKYLAWASINTF